MGFIAPWFLAGLAAAGLPIYFHLLKRTLTNTLFESEPNTDEELEARYVVGFIRHYINSAAVSFQVRAWTTGRYQRTRNIRPAPRPST